MRITAFVEYLPPRLGSDRRIFEIMKRLTHKHEIHFIVFPPSRELLSKLPRHYSKFNFPTSKDINTANCEGIKGHFISISPKIVAMWQHSLAIAYILTFISMFLKSLKTLRKIYPDVVVLNYPSPYTGLLGFLEGKLLKKPVVLDFNDLIAQYSINLLNLEKSSFKARSLVFVQHYIVKKAKIVIAPTRFIKKYTTSLGVPERKVVVIPNGVDTRDFNPQKYNISQIKADLGLEKEKICLYCGRLDAWAGVNTILKLCNIAETEKLDAKFILVGSGTVKIAPKKNAVLLGEVAYEKVPAILAAADTILIPFPNNEVSHAASPLKLFEGMAMQKPIVASKVSGIAEVISDEENGFLANPDNANEWMEKLERILKSDDITKKVGQNARRTVEEKFDWNILAKQYEENINHQSIHPKEKTATAIKQHERLRK